MAAYLIGQIIIHDMEKFMPYVANTTAGNRVFTTYERCNAFFVN